MAGLNWRAKHPPSHMRRAMRSLPPVAAAILLVLTIVLQYNWPKSIPDSGAVGLVTQAVGVASKLDPGWLGQRTAAPKQIVEPGVSYETGADSWLVLSLIGPTQIKLGPESRIRVVNARAIRLDAGRAWLDVGQTGRVFRIATPAGDVTVFGTLLVVEVASGQTVVSVGEGEVTVEKGDSFRVLTRGERLSIPAIGDLSDPEVVADMDAEMAWASGVVPLASASALFEESLSGVVTPASFIGRESFVLPIPPEDRAHGVNVIGIYWTPDEHEAGHCGYHVYVTDGEMKPLLKSYVDGRVFANKARRSCEIAIPGGPVTGAKVLLVRLVPDFSAGSIETKTLGVKARGR
ncbi:MAG: FecR domain-containing protein [Candidatus Hydrogenedentes bacterium]|nr:FecR domain-containing protein [Candidatus Hydrogenedentota bacterium]